MVNWSKFSIISFLYLIVINIFSRTQVLDNPTPSLWPQTYPLVGQICHLQPHIPIYV